MVHKVLLIDGDAANRIVMRVKLAAAHHEVTLADSLAEAVGLLAEQRPAFILADAASIGLTDEALCRAIRACPEGRETGLILLTSNDLAATRVACLAAGADEILAKPVDDLALMPVMRSLIRRYEEAQQLMGTAARVGLVPEAPGSFAHAAFAINPEERGLIQIASSEIVRARQLKAMLAGHMRDAVAVTTLAEALQPNTRAVPDILLIDVGLLDPGTAAAALADLRNRLAGHSTVLFVVTAHDDRAMQALARDMGAADAFAFGSSAPELAARLRVQLARKRSADAQRFQIDEGLRLAAFDPLTGLMNRRAGLIAVDRLMESCRKRGRSMSLLLLDVNDFKTINDSHGHSAGDAVLIELAARIPNALRDGDILFRLGGDEFIVALPDAPNAIARLVARRIERVAGGHLPTLAVGVATAEPDQEIGVEALVALADRAMYRAKSLQRTAGSDRWIA